MIREEWSLPLARVEEFLRGQADVLSLGAGRYRFQNCVATARALPERRVGGLTLPRLRLEYGGSPEDVAELRRRFTLRFLSAGG